MLGTTSPTPTGSPKLVILPPSATRYRPRAAASVSADVRHPSLSRGAPRRDGSLPSTRALRRRRSLSSRPRCLYEQDLAAGRRSGRLLRRWLPGLADAPRARSSDSASISGGQGHARLRLWSGEEHAPPPRHRRLRVVGTDVNAAQIEWARKHVPGIEFHVNELEPPLSFAEDEAVRPRDRSSVFTHIPLDLQRPWLEEIRRILRPSGYFLCTVAGAHHIGIQLSKELRRRLDEEGQVTLNAHDPGVSYATTAAGSGTSSRPGRRCGAPSEACSRCSTTAPRSPGRTFSCCGNPCDVNVLLRMVNRLQEPLFRIVGTVVRGVTALLARILRRGRLPALAERDLVHV